MPMMRDAGWSARLGGCGRFAALVLGLLLLPLAMQPAGLTSTGVAHAEDDEAPRRTQPMTERTYNRLAEAQELLEEDEVDAAINHLRRMLDMRGLNENERGQIYNILGFAYFQSEEYERAIEQYERIVALGEQVPRGLERDALYTLAQLYGVNEQHRAALEHMEIWLEKADDPGPEPHIFMGQQHLQLEEFAEAIEKIEYGIALAQERGREVRENWWQVLRFLYFEREDFPRVVEILEILVRDFPKRQYWVQLAGMYGQLDEEKRQAQAMEAAHAGGFLDRESDYRQLASLLLREQVPFRAARALQEGLEEGIVEETHRNLEMLGQAWQMAQEVDEAVPVYERAAEYAEDGRIYDRLASLYLDRDDLGACITAADRALAEGGLRNRARTQMTRSMCLFEDDRLSDARSGFEECARTARADEDASTERICQQWITHVDNETRRREQLQAGL